MPTFGRTALVVVLPAAVGCSGGREAFEPAPGATVEESDLEGLLLVAMDRRDLDVINNYDLTPPDMDRLPSCFEVEVGPCSPDHQLDPPAGWAVFYRDEANNEIAISLHIALYSQDAAELLGVRTRGLQSIETRAQRLMSNPDYYCMISSGPCDASADPDRDEGCAWQGRRAPRVGDVAGALETRVVPDAGHAMVAFAWLNLLASVTVRAPVGGPPNGLADDLAAALDEQIKLALSQ